MGFKDVRLLYAQSKSQRLATPYTSTCAKEEIYTHIVIKGW